MARTARTLGRGKTREQPLGIALGLGLAATLIVGILFAAALFLIPGTTAHQFFVLIRSNASATLPLDPLYQEWGQKVQEEDVLFGTPLSLLCGGLALGWFAPSYSPDRRVLLSGASLSFAVLAASLALEWSTALSMQKTLNTHEGGQQVALSAPPELLLRLAVCLVIWIAVGVLGTRLGLLLRDRRRRRQTPGAARPVF